ncbi:MAG TPA: hypothetical protein DCY86_15140 [Bdellovibrionales bacterium]|nr:hypothetical protein [Bdellovibrionales bacterium]
MINREFHMDIRPGFHGVIFIFILSCLSAHAGVLSGFRNLTNDMGESVWGFEANCPGGTEGPSHQPEAQRGCIQGIGLSVDSFQELGVRMAEAQEYIWISQAVNERRKVLYANYRHLSLVRVAILTGTVYRDQANATIAQELKRLSENIAMMGKINKMISHVQGDLNYLGVQASAGQVISSQRVASLQQKKKTLQAARTELVRQTPLLAHDKLARFVTDAEYDRFHPERPEFHTGVKEAINDVLESVQEKIDQYDNLQKEEGRLARLVNNPEGAERYRNYLRELTHDTELLEELVVSVDPSRLKGFGVLTYAGCRIENRILRNKAVGELRMLGFNALAMVATMGLASEFALARLATTARVGGIVATEGLMLASTVSEINETRERCRSLKVASFTGGDAHAYVECEHRLSDQIIMGLLGAAGSAVAVTASLSARAGIANAIKVENRYTSALRDFAGAPRARAAELIEFLEKQKVPRAKIESYFEKIKQACHL